MTSTTVNSPIDNGPFSINNPSPIGEIRHLIKLRQAEGVEEWDIYRELVILGYDPDDVIEMLEATGMRARRALQEDYSDIDFNDSIHPTGYPKQPWGWEGLFWIEFILLTFAVAVLCGVCFVLIHDVIVPMTTYSEPDSQDVHGAYADPGF